MVNTGKSLTEKLDRLDPNIDAFDSNYEIFFGKDGLFVGSVLKDLLGALTELQSILLSTQQLN